MKDSLLTTIPEYTNETLEIKDEWDTESIAKQITQHSPLIIIEHHRSSALPLAYVS